MQHDSRFLPQALQVVVVSHLRRENVDDDAAVVEHDPLACRVTVDAERRELVALLGELLDRADDRPRLALAQRAGDDEVIGKNGDLTEVQEQYVFALEIDDRIYDLPGQFDRVQ